jgi:diadenosine tetraphosphate (Ap4A) HIT family hydrolase
MPVKISRGEALRRVSDNVDGNECAMCNIVKDQRPLKDAGTAKAYLNKYPLRWGHTLVVTSDCITTWCDLSQQANNDAQQLILDVAQRLEKNLNATRVYIAALGTNQNGLPQTCPHLHWHIVPLFDHGERPAGTRGLFGNRCRMERTGTTNTGITTFTSLTTKREQHR